MKQRAFYYQMVFQMNKISEIVVQRSISNFGYAVNYGSEQFFMCPMFVTECFHNKCFKLSTLCSVYISPGCESDMILSVMTMAPNKGLTVLS